MNCVEVTYRIRAAPHSIVSHFQWVDLHGSTIYSVFQRHAYEDIKSRWQHVHPTRWNYHRVRLCYYWMMHNNFAQCFYCNVFLALCRTRSDRRIVFADDKGEPIAEVLLLFIIYSMHYILMTKALIVGYEWFHIECICHRSALLHEFLHRCSSP